MFTFNLEKKFIFLIIFDINMKVSLFAYVIGDLNPFVDFKGGFRFHP